MQHVWLREALPVPKIPVEAIARRARSAIKGFQEGRLQLVRHYYACVETLVWLYEVPPPPMGAPEDRTLWDATTGRLLYSVVLNGGTPGKPYRSQAVLTASSPQHAERHLAKSVELQKAKLVHDAGG